MPGPSDHERSQIEALLQRQSIGQIVRGSAVLLLPANDHFKAIVELSILPALRESDLEIRYFAHAFDSDSAVADAVKYILTAEVLIADLTTQPGHLLYVLGLAHALGRCPILLAERHTSLPFDFGALRVLFYDDSANGLYEMRLELARVVRVFLKITQKEQG